MLWHPQTMQRDRPAQHLLCLYALSLAAPCLECCFGLQAGRRWCLSGTPIQNSVDDLYSIFRFLRYNPYCKRPAFKAMLKDPLQETPAKGAQLLQICLKVITPHDSMCVTLCCNLYCQRLAFTAMLRSPTQESTAKVLLIVCLKVCWCCQSWGS